MATGLFENHGVQLAVAFTRSFPSCSSVCLNLLENVFLSRLTVLGSCFSSSHFLFFSRVNFLPCVSVVHFRNQRCCSHPSFSSVSQTALIHRRWSSWCSWIWNGFCLFFCRFRKRKDHSKGGDTIFSSFGFWALLYLPKVHGSKYCSWFSKWTTQEMIWFRLHVLVKLSLPQNT